MRVDAPSRESFNEAMLSLNSAQFVEIRLIYKNMRPQTQTQKISLRLTPLLQICAQKKAAKSIAVHFPAVLVRPGRGTTHTTNDGERGGMPEGCGTLDSLKVWK